MTRILVTGSRDLPYSLDDLSKYWDFECAVADYLRPLGEWLDEFGMPTSHTVIVRGDCPTGLDLIAREWCINAWTPWETFEAEWDRYGKEAGPRRNQKMADSGADVCLGFPLDLSTWSGTLDCMTRASEAGIPVLVDGDPWHPEPWMLERRINV